MSVLSNFDETLNRSDCFVWYNDVFIPFIYNRINISTETTIKTYSLYTAFKPDVLYDGLTPPPNFTEWAINNGKLKYSTVESYIEHETVYDEEHNIYICKPVYIQKIQFTNEFRHDYYKYRDSQKQSSYYNYRYKFTGVEIADPQYRPIVTVKLNYSV